MEVGNLGQPYSLLNLAYVGGYCGYLHSPQLFVGRVRRASVASGLLLLQRKKAILTDGLLLNLMPGSSLLSHGETPHYHRRYGVSLLSSAWGQVGPPR